jgi:polyhydroxybutyrate depolymerase
MKLRILPALAGLAVALLLVTAVVGQRAAVGAGSASAATSVTLQHHGVARRYLLHLPQTRPGEGAPLPLVIAFHGGGEPPENLESITGFDALSDREHFIVAYPEGIDRSWADGRGTTAADRKGTDHVGFAKAVVADIARTHAVDRARVFATGPSNGGIFANTLGCAAADTFAAIAPVIGTIATAVAPKCHLSAPIAVIGVQGVADPVVPFGGGEVGGTLEGAAAGGTVESGRATQELWRRLNGCASTPVVTPVPPHVEDGTSVTRRVYSNCRGGADVEWDEIAGGGHRWPPSQPERPLTRRMADRVLGTSSRNIDASEVIWKFFASHPRP